MIQLVAFWLTYLIIPVLLWALARWLGRRYAVASTDADATRCARCGYDVRALPTNICPECGSDLNVVGRVTLRSSWRRRWTSRLVFPAWALLTLSLCTAFGLATFFQSLPRRQVGHFYQPMVMFINNRQLDWPSLVVLDSEWDMDESARPFVGWYSTRVRKGTLTSVDASRSGSVAGAASEPAVEWNAVNNRWSFRSSISPGQHGSGFPPNAVLLQWAHDAAARRPPRKPLREEVLMGLVVTCGDRLVNSTGTGGINTPAEWTADRRFLLQHGAATVTRAMLGGRYRNSIIPLWPPLVAVVLEWAVMLALSFRSLRRVV